MEIDFSIADLVWSAPLMVLFVFSLIPPLLKAFLGNKELPPWVSMGSGLVGIAFATVLSFVYANANEMAFSKAISLDGVSFMAHILIYLSAAVGLILARENRATCSGQFSEMVFLILNCAIGMMITAMANDLMIVFIGIEYMSLCLYLIIALSREAHLSKEAAFKYFILGSFASAILLYGMALIYGSAGTTYIDELREVALDLVASNMLFMFGVAMILVGFMFKIAVAPFHAWVPDVYDGSPTPVTAFMATGVKVASFVTILRFVSTEGLMGEKSESLLVALQWMAVLTMLVGNIAAILQDSFKRMLAYSGIAHTGYAFIGVIAGAMGGDSGAGSSGVLFYVFSYTIMSLGAFAVISLFESNEETFVQVKDVKGLASRSPWIALCLTVLMLSMAGIPPTLGFFSKFFVFAAALKQGLYWLVFWGIASSAISAFYYLRPIVYMYMYDEVGLQPAPERRLTRWAISFSMSLVFFLGFVSNPIMDAFREAVKALFLGAA